MPTPAIITVTPNTALDTVVEVPRFAIGGHQSGRRLSRYPAGKGVNVSRALARLGCASIVAGFVGRDEAAVFRQFIKHDSASLATSRLIPVAGSTRQNVTILDPVRRTETHVREAGFAVTHDDLRRLRASLLRLAKPPCILSFSGSLPPGFSALQLGELFDSLARRGASLVLDTGGELLRHILFSPSAPDRPLLMIKPNLAEVAELLGAGLPVDEKELVGLVRPLTDRVGFVAVTRGAQGALLVSRTEAWLGCVDVDPAGVVSTVGCGDCMLAGLLAAYAENAPPSEMLRRGLALATANVFEHGAATFDPHRLAALRPRVTALKP